MKVALTMLAAAVTLAASSLLQAGPTVHPVVAVTKPPLKAAAGNPPASPTWRFDEIIAAAKQVKADNRELEDSVADLSRMVLSVDAAWRQAYDDQDRQHRREIKKFDRWYVKAVVWCARQIKLLLIGYALLCVIAIGTSYLNPLGAPFMFGRFLFNNLFGMGWTQVFSSRAVLPAK